MTRAAWAVAALLLLAWIWIGGALTRDGLPRGLVALVKWCVHAPGPLAWMLSALGLGAALTGRLSAGSKPWVLSLGVGCAALLLLDTVAASIGLYRSSNAQAIGVLMILPGFLALWKFVSIPFPLRLSNPTHPSAGRWLAWTLAPALAALVLASASAPGWLWSTEFGGYDALSYHLELPREWLARGRLVTLEHNVYSALPSFMEAGYLHVMALRDSAQGAALDAQILHGLFALAAAAMTGSLGARIVSRALPTLAPASATAWVVGAMLLGTPWVIVTGSLAYDEMALILFMGASLWLALDNDRGLRRGHFALLGLLAGAACGAKLTALLAVVAPTVVVIVASQRHSARSLRETLVGLGVMALVMIAVLSPWWVRGAIDHGSPFFPIAGAAWLTPEQASTFHAAHASEGMSQWWRSLGNEFLFAGLTDAGPDSMTPWRPFWSVLPWLAALAAVWLAVPRSTRRVSMLLGAVVLTQVALWLIFTHAKGRFLLPAVVPMALLVGIALSSLARAGWLGKAALASLAALWCLQPLLCYATDGPIIEGHPTPATAIGLEPLFMGETPEPGLPKSLTQLPAGSRVATLGAATVFWWPMIPDYSTVWNDGAVSRAIKAAHGDGAEAVRELSRHGFTHIVIDTTMLGVWRRSGWLDGAITPDAISSLKSALIEKGAFGSTALFAIEPRVP